jgi:hypothetical protein
MSSGKAFPAKREDVIGQTDRARLPGSGVLDTTQQLQPSALFVAKVRHRADEITAPLRCGASALAAIYTGQGPDVFRLLRELEIRSES